MIIGSRHRLSVRGVFVLLLAGVFVLDSPAFGRVTWIRKSTTTGDLPAPNPGTQQTCCVVFDVDGDGIDDFVIGERTRTPSVVWYKYNGKGWNKYVIDETPLRPEAGGAAYDITGNGYLDLVLGQDASGNAIWWWENPAPDFTRPWTRRFIKNSGGHKHHDQTFGDFIGEGRAQFVTWNQGDKKLLLYRIPDDPRSTEPWSSSTICQWATGREREGFPSVQADINGDGKLNIVGGGRWFGHIEGDRFVEHIIDEDMAFTQCAVGQLVKGGRPEVVFSPGDMDGMAKWYQWDGQTWVGHDLTFVRHGHTCEIADIDGDGHLDILIGEMGKPGAGDDAKIYIWYGDGQGNFEKTVAWHGQGIHEGLLGDFNGNGRLDILLKPYSHNAPRIDILLNGGTQKTSLDKWRRHHIADLPHRAMFVQAGDINGNGRMDLIAGAWWWENPGTLGGKWKQHTLEPLRNMAAVYDFDGDTHLDILGTQGRGSESNNRFVWARNDGDEWPTFVLGKVTQGEPDRCRLADINGNGQLDAVVSLENGTDILWFEAPADPTGPWKRHKIGSVAGQGLCMDVADFNSSGHPDVLVGEHRGEDTSRVIIFENLGNGASWATHVIDSGPRNQIDHHDGTLAFDMDRDGDLGIISIGWYNPKLWIYENKAID